MQFDVLRGLCGSKVHELAEEDFESVQEAGEEVLVVNLNGPKHTITLAGPTGSFERALQAIEAEQDVETGEAGKGEVVGGIWRGVFGGMCVFGTQG